MSEVLTVPTHFGDLSELSAGLADRVDEERLILYGPTPFDEGAMVGFSVLLVDGTPALEGVGRVAAAGDGGEERAPETRFDIVFDSLQLDGRSEVVYERIVLARSSMMGDEPATGEVSIEELEEQVEDVDADAADVSFASEAPPAGEVEMGAVDVGAAEVDVAMGDAGGEDAGAGDYAESFPQADAEAASAEGEYAESFPQAEGAPEGDYAESFPQADAEPAAGDYAESFPQAEGAPEGDYAESFPQAEETAPGAEAVAEEAVAVDAGQVDAGQADEGWADAQDVAFDEGAGDPEVADYGEYDDGSEATMVADVGMLSRPPVEAPEGAPAPELPQAPTGFEIQAAEGALTRPVYPPSWAPEASPRPEPRPSTGHFLYEGGLPIPAEPPRPDIDPTLRVSPAPRPGQEAPPPAMPSAEAAPVEDAPLEQGFEEAGIEDVGVEDAGIEHVGIEDAGIEDVQEVDAAAFEEASFDEGAPVDDAAIAVEAAEGAEVAFDDFDAAADANGEGVVEAAEPPTELLADVDGEDVAFDEGETRHEMELPEADENQPV